jgi:hypothetical protein
MNGPELQGLVDSIVASTSGLPTPAAVASWGPALSGDIDIRIASDGSWYHAGSRIQREGLVRLFASILRRERDGNYYLVTPAEKWRIVVERHPLVAVDCDYSGNNGSGVWYVLLNTGGRCRLGGEHGLYVSGAAGSESALEAAAPGGTATDGVLPWVALPNGLSAQLSRAAWYRLIDAATVEGDHAFITSAGERMELGGIAAE